jgi:hypothetical protein
VQLDHTGTIVSAAVGFAPTRSLTLLLGAERSRTDDEITIYSDGSSSERGGLVEFVSAELCYAFLARATPGTPADYYTGTWEIPLRRRPPRWIAMVFILDQRHTACVSIVRFDHDATLALHRSPRRDGAGDHRPHHT